MTKANLRNSVSRIFARIGSLALALVILAGTLVMTTTTAYAAGFGAGSTVYVDVEDYLYLHDGSQGPRVGKVPRGAALTIISGPDRNTYYKVRVNSTGEVWWVYGGYLTSSYIAQTRTTHAVGSSTSQSTSPTQSTSTTSSTSSSTSTTSRSSIESEQAQLAKAHKNDAFIGELDSKYVRYYDNVTADYTSPDGTIMYVQSQKRLNLRRRPDMESARIRFLLRGELLTVFPDTLKNNYVKVIAWLDGAEGWVHKDYIGFSQPSDIYYVGFWDNEALVNILGADWEDDLDHCCGCQDERSEEWHRIWTD